MRTPDDVYYLHGDHLSSTSLVTKPDNSVQASRRYRPYGEPRPLSGTLPTDRTYTDQRDEPSLGIMDYRARYYSVRLGRFLSADTIVPDPTNPQDLNRYGYVRNNPQKYVDPDGHIALAATLLIAGGLGALAGGGVDLVIQLAVDGRAWEEVNWARVGGAAAGGGVAGLTLGLAPVGASVWTMAAFGGLGGLAGGQVEALTQASLEQVLGDDPQRGVIEEAMELGLLDPATMVVDTSLGAVTGLLSAEFTRLAKPYLKIPESAGLIVRDGRLAMIKPQPGADAKYTVELSGRILAMEANTFERLVRGVAIYGYEWLDSAFGEALEEGAIRLIGVVSEKVEQP